MWLRLVAALLAVGLWVLPHGAWASRQEPIYNVVNHPIPAAAQKLSPDQIAKAIVAAGTAKPRWQIAPSGPGILTGVLDARGKHQATVSIAYSTAGFSITLVSSTNLLQEGNLIHRNYNKWVRDLEQNIDRELTREAMATR